MKKNFITFISAVSLLFSAGTIVGAAEAHTPIAEGTYNGHTYQVFDKGLSWKEAKEYCESIGGYLSCISTENEQEFIMSLMSNGEKNCYWLGGYKKDNGDFAWLSNEDFDYENWDVSEPSGGEEDCLQIYRIPDPAKWDCTAGSWNDIVDEGAINFHAAENFGFICEWDNVLSSSDSDIDTNEDSFSSEKKYNGHTYQVFDESLTWEEAKEYCHNLGGHLVTITSEEEQKFIETLLEEGKKKQYWIGMRTAGGPGWITGETYQYSNWDKGEPNNKHKENSNEDYVHIYNVANPAVYGSERFKWNDMFGDNTYPGEEDHFALKYVGFICEWDNVFSSFGSEISEWASDEIEIAYDKELIPEILVGEDLTQPITRAEFAAVSVKAYELMANTKALPAVNNPFTDTKDLEVLKAYNTGITTGISATEFNPDALLNREQAATMLTRVFKRSTMKGWTIETDSQFKLDYNKPAIFADDSRISDWAKDSVYFMAANEIINGVGSNKFAPQNTTTEEEANKYANATREQALIIATRMVENLK